MYTCPQNGGGFEVFSLSPFWNGEAWYSSQKTCFANSKLNHGLIVDILNINLVRTGVNCFLLRKQHQALDINLSALLGA